MFEVNCCDKNFQGWMTSSLERQFALRQRPESSFLKVSLEVPKKNLLVMGMSCGSKLTRSTYDFLFIVHV